MIQQTISVKLNSPNQDVAKQAEKALAEIMTNKELGAVGLVVMLNEFKNSTTVRIALKKRIRNFKSKHGL